MSMEQLYELYDEIELETIFNNACNSEQFWNEGTDEDKYKAYIAAYHKYNKEMNDASFKNFVYNIHNKLKNVEGDQDYADAFGEITVHDLNNINNIVHLVETNEKNWVEGLTMLYSIDDLSIYGW
jgi:hypothetical protein